MDYQILIIGSDINAYTMARCSHELLNKKIDLIAKSEMKFTSLSNITNIIYEPLIQEEKTFKKVLKEYGEKNKTKKIILIGTNDFYVKLISKNAKYLSKWFLFNYPEYKTTTSLLEKDEFYNKYKDKLDMPKTYIYSCLEQKLDLKDFLYPIIVKPGDGVSYYKHKFEGQSKVYKVYNEEELNSVIKQIENSGYEEKLIIQEFIPGDDSKLFDSMFYVDSKGNPVHATFAQIALQEHTNTGVGNCTCLINGFNENKDKENVINKLKDFLVSINYNGFAEFDLKYDERDNKYKVFEINPRQARCSYYFSLSCENLIKCLVDDLIYNKTKKYKLSSKKVVLSFVPKVVIYSKVKNEKLLKELKKVIKKDGYTNTLDYKNDKHLKRKVYLLLRKINYVKKYRKDNWW